MADSYFGQFTVIRIDADGEREILPEEDIFVYLESDDTELTDFAATIDGVVESAALSGIDPDTKVYFLSKSYSGRLYQETKAVQADAFQNPCTLIVENLYSETTETEVCDIYLEDLDGDVPTVFIGSVKPGGTLRVPYQPLKTTTANVYKINRDASGQMSTSKFQQADKETITDATSRPTITIGSTQIVGVATDKLIGRETSGTGAAEQIGLSSKLSMSSLTLDIVEANLTHNNIGGTLGISKGGSGQTTANAALNAFLPSQSGNSGKFLKTDGSNSAWESVSSGITIGSTSISSGTNNRVLFQSSGVVSQSDRLQFDGTDFSLVNPTAATSGAPSVVSPYFILSGARWNGSESRDAKVRMFTVPQAPTSIYSTGFGMDFFRPYDNTWQTGFRYISKSDDYLFTQLELRNPAESSFGGIIRIGSGGTFNFLTLAGAVSPIGAGALGASPEAFPTLSFLQNTPYGVSLNAYFGAAIRFASGYPGTGANGSGSEYVQNDLEFRQADGKNIVFGTTTGTKIGTGSTQKIGFFGVTPVVQPSALNDITDGISGTVLSTMISVDDGGGNVDLTLTDDNFKTLLTLVNQIKTKLEALGIVAT